MKLAFIDGVFPGLTSTFINREFEYLQSNTDWDIQPISLKRPPIETLNQEYKQYVEITKYLRPDALWGIVFLNVLTLLTRPLSYCRGLLLVLREWPKYPVSVGIRTWFHFFCGVYLSYYLRRHHFGAIHAHFSTASTIALFAHFFSGIPFSFTLHASDDLYSFPILLQAKAHYARCIITNNQYNEAHINLLTRYAYRDKLYVIYNGLDLSRFSDMCAKTQRSHPMRMLSVGSFTGCKGYPTALKALQILKQEGVEFVYTIVGGGNPDEKVMLETLIVEYGLQQNVLLLGRQPFTRVAQELEATDIEIMASEIYDRGIRDGLPNVIIEAMLFKRPVVTTYISDIPNLVKHGETGYLLPEKNFLALVDILRYLYQHYEETLPVVERAHTLAICTFDAQQNYRRLVELISQ